MRHESDWTTAPADGPAELAGPARPPAPEDDRHLAAMLGLCAVAGLAGWAGLIAGVVALLR